MHTQYKDLRHRMTSKPQNIEMLNIFLGADIEKAS